MKQKDTVIRTGKDVEKVKGALLDEVFGETRNPQALDQLESLLTETKGRGGNSPHKPLTKKEAGGPMKEEHERKAREFYDDWHTKKISPAFKMKHIRDVLTKNPLEARKRYYKSSYYGKK